MGMNGSSLAEIERQMKLCDRHFAKLTLIENEVLWSRLLANDIVVAVPSDIIAKVKAHDIRTA
jgi:hypothetical protein